MLHTSYNIHGIRRPVFLASTTSLHPGFITHQWEISQRFTHSHSDVIMAPSHWWVSLNGSLQKWMLKLAVWLMPQWNPETLHDSHCRLAWPTQTTLAKPPRPPESQHASSWITGGLVGFFLYKPLEGTFYTYSQPTGKHKSFKKEKKM